MLLRIVALCFAAFGCGAREADFARSLAVRTAADVVLRNGKIVTVDGAFSIQEAVAIRDGRFVGLGTEREMRPYIGAHTRVIDLNGRTVIPGLNDSHMHATVAGLHWDGELHWEFHRTLDDGLRQIAAAARKQPPGSWIVVGGGWVPTQFAELRLPTRGELDALAPNHPVYIQYLRQGALLNSAALAALGITGKTPEPAGGRFERNPNTGELTGWLQGAAWEFAYNKIPHLSIGAARQSLGNLFRELNRLGITSVGDVQSGGVNFFHRRVLSSMAASGELSLRINYYVAPNEPGDELEQLQLAAAQNHTLVQNDLLRFAGFGEVLLQGLDDGDGLAGSSGIQLSSQSREKLRAMVRYFAEAGHGFHLHVTHDHSARQLLDVIEQVHAETPFKRQRMVFAHLEDASAETINRIKNLGGAIAVQNRLALTGERVAQLWGAAKVRQAPPLRTMLESGVRLGAGSDAFAGGNYSPMLSLWWLTTGKTVGGLALRDAKQNLSRAEALRLYTLGSASLTGDEGRKGSIEVDKWADLAVLSGDYLTVPDEQLPTLVSLLTMVGGKIVYGAGPYAGLAK